jgi:hypothetical protein
LPTLLEHQEVVLTVPASFDEAAHELTLEAARRAGLSVRLLEEPQAAFHDFMQRAGPGNEGEGTSRCDASASAAQAIDSVPVTILRPGSRLLGLPQELLQRSRLLRI